MFTAQDGSAAVKVLALAAMPERKMQLKTCRKWTRQIVDKLQSEIPPHTLPELHAPMLAAREAARSAMRLRCQLCRRCPGI
jgi:hypothetical protein